MYVKHQFLDKILVVVNSDSDTVLYVFIYTVQHFTNNEITIVYQVTLILYKMLFPLIDVPMTELC